MDQFVDEDGIFRFYILQRSGPYGFEVYSGDSFIRNRPKNCGLLIGISARSMDAIDHTIKLLTGSLRIWTNTYS
jgi:hypothetical protein